MEFFLAGSQGLGLAAAAGLLFGFARSLKSRAFRIGLPLVAVAAGAALCGGSLESVGHPPWPGYILGALIALVSTVAANSIFSGASKRLDGENSGQFLILYLVLAAVAVAVLAVALPPASLVVFAVLVWLLIKRRKQRPKKYQGLRILR